MVFTEVQKAKIDRLKEIYREEGILGVFAGIYRCTKYNLRLKPFRSLYRYNLNRLIYTNSLANPWKLIRMNPKEVEYMVVPRFDEDYSKTYSYVIGGEWEQRIEDKPFNKTTSSRNRSNKRSLIPFENYYLYDSFKKHFVDGLAWEDTEFYKKKIKDIEEGNIDPSKRYGTKEKLQNRLEGLDRLFEKIKEEGYNSQEEIHKEGVKDKDVPLKQDGFISQKREILIDIGSDGRLIFDDGRHRMIIAKILELGSIPVRVLVRHKEWQKLRQKITKANSRDELSDKGLEHLDHPDMEDINKNIELN